MMPNLQLLLTLLISISLSIKNYLSVTYFNLELSRDHSELFKKFPNQKPNAWCDLCIKLIVMIGDKALPRSLILFRILLFYYFIFFIRIWQRQCRKNSWQQDYISNIIIRQMTLAKFQTILEKDTLLDFAIHQWKLVDKVFLKTCFLQSCRRKKEKFKICWESSGAIYGLYLQKPCVSDSTLFRLILSAGNIPTYKLAKMLRSILKS